MLLFRQRLFGTRRWWPELDCDGFSAFLRTRSKGCDELGHASLQSVADRLRVGQTHRMCGYNNFYASPTTYQLPVWYATTTIPYLFLRHGESDEGTREKRNARMYGTSTNAVSNPSRGTWIGICDSPRVSICLKCKQHVQKETPWAQSCRKFRLFLHESLGRLLSSSQ